MSALLEWNDPHIYQDVALAQEVINELTSACRKMLECTGGSKYWDGETHKALLAIENALGVEIE